MDTTGALVLVAAVVVVLVVGLVLRLRSGRVRTARPDGTAGPGTDGWALAGTRPADGETALLLQLSSPVCAPCRQTAAVLADLAAGDPALRHVEVDVAERVDVARALGVLRTPTTVAFDRDGTELLRVSGVPRVDDLRAALTGRPAPE